MEAIFQNEAVVWCLVVIAVVLLVLLLRVTAKKYAGSKVALIMLAVEKRLSTWIEGQTDGMQKHQAAIFLVGLVYPRLPFWVKMFVTQDQAVKYIEQAYDQMLHYAHLDQIHTQE